MKPADIDQVPAIVRLSDGSEADSNVRLERRKRGDEWRSALVNGSAEPIAVKEVVLFQGETGLPPETRVYGEGFQKLSQYVGTFAGVECLSGHTDARHYRIPQAEGCVTLYNVAVLTPPEGETLLLGFTSCRRFAGEIRLFPDCRFEAVLDTEGLVLRPSERWELEGFTILTAPDSASALRRLADAIAANHPRLPFDPAPTGWCSWYCLGPGVTEQDILENLDAAAERHPDLCYVQIDDGYQSRMGDWLTPGDKFPSGMERLCKGIREKGFEPAMWVAPFIAEEASEVFRQHPEWFMRDEEGNPLCSDRVTFGGWRCGPWYALDGTHPGAREHLVNVFRTMREEWGCTYFKLDANFWGAMHGGRLHDPEATRIEAYRRGMEAVLQGAGDAFILGCNAPMWPSIGLVHGMRVSNDCSRSWDSFTSVAREFLHRNWQNGTLWINDPDCLLLVPNEREQPSEDEFMFHAATVLASGGMVLSGDDLRLMPEDASTILDRLVPPIGVAAEFPDDSFCVGTIEANGNMILVALNWNDSPAAVNLPREIGSAAADFWTGMPVSLGRSGRLELAPRSARVLVCRR